MPLHGLEQDSYKDSSRNQLLQHLVNKIYQYHSTTTNSSNSFCIISIDCLPKGRDVPPCPGRQVFRQNYFSGVEGAPNHSRYFGGSTQEPRGTWSRLPSGTDNTATRAHSLSAGLLSRIQGDQTQLRQTEANPNTSIPKVLVQFKSLSHHSSLHQFSLLSHFYTSFILFFFMFHMLHLNTGLPTSS